MWQTCLHFETHHLLMGLWRMRAVALIRPLIIVGYKKIPIITNTQVGLGQRHQNLLPFGVLGIQGSQWVLPGHKQGSLREQVQLLWLVQKAAKLTPNWASLFGFPIGFRPR